MNYSTRSSYKRSFSFLYCKRGQTSQVGSLESEIKQCFLCISKLTGAIKFLEITAQTEFWNSHLNNLPSFDECTNSLYRFTCTLFVYTRYMFMQS
jgi:hypothetical protein